MDAQARRGFVGAAADASQSCRSVRDTSLVIRQAALMDDHAARVVARVFDEIENYAQGGSSLPEVQLQLEAAAGALDSSNLEVAEALMSASNDIELIMFATSTADQQPAADRCFTTLRARLGLT